MILIQIISFLIFIVLAVIYLLGLLISITHPLYKIGFALFVLLLSLALAVTLGSLSTVFITFVVLMLVWHLVMRSISNKNSCRVRINGYKGIISLGFLNIMKLMPNRVINKHLKKYNLEVSNFKDLVKLIKKEASGTKIEVESKGNKIIIEVL